MISEGLQANPTNCRNESDRLWTATRLVCSEEFIKFGTMKATHPFLNPALRPSNIDLYVVRKGILRAMKNQLESFSGRFLDVGAGNQPYRPLLTSKISRIKEYVPLDLANNFHYKDADFSWDGISMPFEDHEFDSAMATEVLEHCPHPEITLCEIARVLKPGGHFFFTVPFLWPLHDAPHDEYRYTPWSLERHLKSAGFSEIRLQPTGGWDAALAQAIGLWVRRRPMSDIHRKWLSWAIFPLYKWLIAKDLPVNEFHHGFYLMPGISGTARAPE